MAERAGTLGVFDGTNAKSIRVVTGGDTASTIEAKRLAQERGLNLVLFTGNNLDIEDNGVKISARAHIDGDNVYVRADHPRYTADQLMRHEAGHDMIDKGEINPKSVRDRIAAMHNGGNIDELSRRYAEAYVGSNMTPEEIWDEIICDSLGDMNIFSESETETETVESIETVKRSAEQETPSARGPPYARKSSREFDSVAKNSRELFENGAERGYNGTKYQSFDLSKKAWNLLNTRMEREIGSSRRVIDEATKWLYAEENGTSVFAVYGIGDGTDATPLYASSGKRARADYTKWTNFWEGYLNELDANRTDFDSWLESVRGEQWYKRNNLHDSAGRAPDANNDRVYGRTSERDGRGTSETGAENRDEVSDYSPDYEAWRNLMKEGIEEGENRYSAEPTNETDQTDSLTETQEAVRTAVREELERMGKEYGWIKAGEKPFRDVQIPQKRSPETQLYSIVIKETSGSL